ncbi:hypothetical protein GCM10018987_07900 [Streptomyces cremeus]
MWGAPRGSWFRTPDTSPGPARPETVPPREIHHPPLAAAPGPGRGAERLHRGLQEVRTKVSAFGRPTRTDGQCSCSKQKRARYGAMGGRCMPERGRGHGRARGAYAASAFRVTVMGESCTNAGARRNGLPGAEAVGVAGRGPYAPGVAGPLIKR